MKKHFALHGLDAVSYREKYGLKKSTPLTSKELQRTRRAKMKDMKLWEKRAMARKMTLGSIEDLYATQINHSRAGAEKLLLFSLYKDSGQATEIIRETTS